MRILEHVVLDIDETLAEAKEYGDIQKYIKAKLIPADSVINICGYDHYIYHGAVEFLQWLLDITEGHLSFMSGGAKERNDIFVRELLGRAISSEKHASMSAKIKVFSREDLFDGRRNEELQPDIHGFYGNRKKDLRIALQAGWCIDDTRREMSGELVDRLKRTIIIDDDRSYLIQGQEKHIVVAAGGSPWRALESQNRKSDSPDLFLSLNKLFVTAGLLSTALTRANETGEAVTEVLHRMQFEYNLSYSSRIEWDYNRSIRESPEYFLAGMSILRQYNPSLEFFGAEKLVPNWCLSDKLRVTATDAVISENICSDANAIPAASMPTARSLLFSYPVTILNEFNNKLWETMVNNRHADAKSQAEYDKAYGIVCWKQKF